MSGWLGSFGVWSCGLWSGWLVWLSISRQLFGDSLDLCTLGFSLRLSLLCLLLLLLFDLLLLLLLFLDNSCFFLLFGLALLDLGLSSLRSAFRSSCLGLGGSAIWLLSSGSSALSLFFLAFCPLFLGLLLEDLGSGDITGGFRLSGWVAGRGVSLTLGCLCFSLSALRV